MSEPHVTMHTCSSRQELAVELADKAAALLAEAVAQRGTASLVVSGGTTPEPFFSRLSCKRSNWERITVTLADERWVETNEPASNEHLVRSVLLRNEAACARFIGLKNNAPAAAAGEKQCSKALRAAPRPFDLVILGMGEDGHTASLFPGAARLREAVDMLSGRDCMAISPPGAPFERMTLTLPTLLDSRMIILLITGEGKKRVLEKAMTEGREEDMPVRFILRQGKTPIQIYWAK